MTTGEFSIHQFVEKNTCNVMETFSNTFGFAIDAKNTMLENGCLEKAMICCLVQWEMT